jgi:hypothetical protein
MPVLNHVQFQQLAEEANTLNPDWGNESGFTVKLQQGPKGEIQRASDVNMVGGVVPTISHDAPIGAQSMVRFTRHHANLLAQSEMFVGVWHEGNRQPTAQVDLDVAEAFPRTPEGRLSARIVTIARGEKAYGEVPPGDYETHVNPFRTPMAKEKEHGVSEWRKRLMSDPASYASVVGGDVLGAMAGWSSR